MTNFVEKKEGKRDMREQAGRTRYRRILLLYTGIASSVLAPIPLFSALAKSSLQDHMLLTEKVGQMLQVQCYLTSANGTATDVSHLVEEMKRYHLGSLDFRIPLNGPNLVRAESAEVAETLNALQRASPIPLLIGADIERGLIARVSDAPDMPSVMAWGAAGDHRSVRLLGETTAEEARAIGIQWAFAPVVDVNNDPDNPIIGDRSFGDDPSQVGAMVAEYIEGAHTKGLLTTAKHFPGHGDTATDSHVAIMTLNQSLGHLKQIEFPPFEKAIAANVDAIMLAHARVPALDPDPSKIATTSKKMIEGTLRKDLGFRGLVVTDSMEMRGLTDLYKGDPHPVGRAAVDAIKAGADIIMLPEHIGEAYDAILHAVQMGEIPESRIDESVQRILAMKERAGLFKNRFVDESKVKEVFSKKSSWDLAQQVADDSVTLVRDKGFALPLVPAVSSKPDKPRTVLVLLTDSRRSPLGTALEEEFKRRQPDAQIRHVYYDNRSTWETSDLLDVVRGANSVVIAAFMTNLPGRKDMAAGGKVVDVVGLNGQTAELFRQMVTIAGSKAMIVSLGSPYLILHYPAIQNYICTFSISSTSERAAVKALFGEIQNKAKLPVSLPGVAARGFAIAWPQRTVIPN